VCQFHKGGEGKKKKKWGYIGLMGLWVKAATRGEEETSMPFAASLRPQEN
jgi:hypothetical protein